MKHRETLVWIMLAESVLFPVIVGLSRIFGYTLRAGNSIIYTAAATALYVFCTVRLLRSKDKQIGTAAMIALSVTLLLNQLQTLYFIIYVFKAESSIFSMLLLAFWFWVTVIVAAAYVKYTALKVVFYILSGLLVLPIGLFLLLSGFGSVEVVSTTVSPGGAWCAEVVESNEGALGGSMTVDVYRCKDSFSIGSFEFRKDEAEIYHGGWGSVRDVDWTDDEHLSINNSTYKIPTDYECENPVVKAVKGIFGLPKLLTSQQ